MPFPDAPDESYFEGRSNAVADRLPAADAGRFKEAIDVLRDGTPSELLEALRLAHAAGRGRSAMDIDVAINPLQALDEEAYGRTIFPDEDAADDDGYEWLHIEAGAREYVRKLFDVFKFEGRRSTATVVEYDGLARYDEDGDIVPARELRSLLRGVRSSAVPHESAGMLPDMQLRQFLVGPMPHARATVRGVHEGDTFWLHGCMYDRQVRQFAEQLFALTHFAVYLPPPGGEASGATPHIRSVRRAIERLDLLRGESSIRYGVVWDKENARRKGVGPGSVSDQLTGMGTTVLPAIRA